MSFHIAIIGGGVSGLVTAHLLGREHEVTVFEARDRVGGHVNTVDVVGPGGRRLAVDTGFIVYNEGNYPLFTALLAQLGVSTQQSNMSFGVRSDASGIEYSGATLRTLFAQKRNLFKPRFHRMIRDILRFNREAGAAVRDGAAGLSLGEYLEVAGFSSAVADDYLLPMGSALWSTPRGKVLGMPAEFFVRFFENHGMLTVNEQLEWRVIRGGSDRYVAALTRSFRDRIRLASPVHAVARSGDGVEVDGERFDHVVFGCHSDQALAILEDPTPREREILGALPFQDNDVVLHTDTSVLPRSRRAWASWNYHVSGEDDVPATVTYNMNRLQTLPGETTYCVTLNSPQLVDPERILYQTRYRHPEYTLEGARARARHSEISGRGRTHYCGAYWGFGFHEDGVRSAVDVAKSFGIEP